MLKPDAYAVVGTGEFEQHAFIEVDLGTTSSRRLAVKGQSYIDYHATRLEQRRVGVFPVVIWVANSTERTRVISRALQSLGSFGFELSTVDEFIGLMSEDQT